MNNFLFFYNFVISCKVLARLIINFAIEFVRGRVSSHVRRASCGRNRRCSASSCKYQNYYYDAQQHQKKTTRRMTRSSFRRIMKMAALKLQFSQANNRVRRARTVDQSNTFKISILMENLSRIHRKRGESMPKFSEKCDFFK